MKANNTFFRIRMFSYIFPILILLASYQGVEAQTLVVPPSPGDLSLADHLKQSDDYTVEVKKSGDANYTTCFVYYTDNWASNYWGGERRPQTGVSFTNFSFDGTPVDVRITTKFTATSVTIRPLAYGVVPVRDGNVITFTLTTPRKVSVEVNNRLHPLFIFADKPDVVPSPSSVTYFYGPGYHNIGLHKQLNSNETVYIAGGAVIEGTFYMPTNSHNITVRGRGIISGGKLPTAVERTNKIDSIQKYSVFTGKKDKYGSTVHYNCNFEGFTMVNTCGTHFAMVNTSHTNHDNTFRNLKEVDWSVNTDNVFDGDNNIVDDCFFFQNDDMTVTRSSFNLKITNCVFWNFIGRLLWTANYGTSSDCLWENIEIIGDDKGPDFTDISSGTSGLMKNFTFRNINIESRVSKFIKIKTGTTKIENWVFENVTFPDLKNDEGTFIGNSSGTIDITFKNLKMGGRYIKSLDEGNMNADQFCDIKFVVESAPKMNIKQGSTDIPMKTGSLNFGNVPVGSSKKVTFIIENKGELPLNLTGSPRVLVSGAGFSLVTDAFSSVINSGESTSFQVKFTPDAAGKFNGSVSIANSDNQLDPYTFLLTGTEASSANLIANPTFDTDLTGWGGYREPSTVTTNELVSKSGYSGKACKVNITNGGTVNWHVQLAYNFPIVEGKNYTISFKASADANRSVNYSFQQNLGPKVVYTTSPNINLTTTPTTYGPYTFISTVTDNDQSFRFLLGASNSSVYIDDVVITEVSTVTAVQSNLIENSVLKIYPNPASELLSVELEGVKSGKIGINLFDLNGRLLLNKMLQASDDKGLTCELNVGQVKEGIYLIKVRTDESLLSERVMVWR